MKCRYCASTKAELISVMPSVPPVDNKAWVYVCLDCGAETVYNGVTEPVEIRENPRDMGDNPDNFSIGYPSDYEPDYEDEP